MAPGASKRPDVTGSIAGFGDGELGQRAKAGFAGGERAIPLLRIQRERLGGVQPSRQRQFLLKKRTL